MADTLAGLRLDVNSLSNNGELLLVEVVPIKRYVDGKATEESDFKCIVVAPRNNYQRYDVIVSKKPEVNLLPDTAVPVSFEELSVKIYRSYKDGGNYALSCKASAVVPVIKKQ